MALTAAASRNLVRNVIERCRLPLYSTFGLTHWARVLSIGRRLASVTGADQRVVELFALFHDAGRCSEGADEGHGLRAADLARKLRGGLYVLPDRLFDELYLACARHSEPHVPASVTVMTCWDANRLDLARLGITPDPAMMQTRQARDPDLIAWATTRSRAGLLPAEVCNQWSLEDILSYSY
ncbi:HD domain-containing protein [Candidatus Fermentibacterales bacterium]|nr:HD domain-containing protein [Candidatus Fermentibacterales bacterium]